MNKRSSTSTDVTTAAIDWHADQALSPALAGLYLALTRKLRAMRDKGRTLTPRAQRQWLKSEHWKHAVESVFLEAARATARSRYTPTEHFEAIGRWLRIELLDCRYPKAGRPRRRKGLIGSAMAEAKIGSLGRPRLMTPAAERGLLAYVYGVKMRIFLEREKREYLTLEAISRLLSNIGGAEGLDTEVSDGDALSEPTVQARVPPSKPQAQAKRLQRARRRYPFVLPRR